MFDRLFDLLTGTTDEITRRVYDAADEIDSFIPGFSRQKGCFHGVGAHREGDHSVLFHVGFVTAHAASRILAFREHPDGVRTARVLLAAVLAHDVGKVDTREEKAGGKVTFYGHAGLEADRVPSYAGNFLEHPEDVKLMEWLVRHHMDAHELVKFGLEKKLAIYDHPGFELLLTVQSADALGTWMDDAGTTTTPVLTDALRADRIAAFAERERKVFFDWMKTTVTARLHHHGIPVGPKFGKTIKAAQQAMPTRADAPSEDVVNTWVDANLPA